MSLFTTLVTVASFSEVGNDLESKDTFEIVLEKVNQSRWFSLNIGTFPGRHRPLFQTGVSSSSPRVSLQLKGRSLGKERVGERCQQV